MITTTFIILGFTILLFVWGKLSPDMVALISMLALFVTGVLNLSETLSGFSNPTVIMIASLFIIGEGLSKTGWTAYAGSKFIKMAKSSIPRMVVILTLGSGLLSGFVSNTGTVATLLPVSISTAWKLGTLPSKVLMPIAFGSNSGGLLTLTGTPPNIIASNALIESGQEGFSFFEFALIGIPILIITVLYFRYVGFKLLPSNKTNNKPVDIDSTLHKWIEAYKVHNDYYRLRVRSVSPLLGTKFSEWDFEKNYNVQIIRLKRRHPNVLKGIPQFIELPDTETEFMYHDIITIKGETDAVNKLMIKFRLGLLPIDDSEAENEVKTNLINQEIGMSEIMVTPKSFLVGRKIKIGNYFEGFGFQILAVSRNNRPLSGTEVTVKAGDAFLVRGKWGDIDKLKDHYENLVICGSPEELSKDVIHITPKSYIALGALVLMIALLVFKILPGAVAALLCAGIVLLSGCVPLEKAYKGISWMSVVMIAAMIPMGVALQKTGAAQLVANSLVDGLGNMNPIILLAGIFLLTTLFSQVINNSATAILMAPIVILTAQSLGVSPKPFMIIVAVSASTAFLTPIGTTTNAMVMGAGGYKFKDYVKVGGPLLLCVITATVILVPLIWPL